MREFVREYLRRARPDLNIKTGTPLELQMIDPLAALLPVLDDKIETKFDLGLDEKAELYLCERDPGSKSEFIVRFYFVSATELTYGAREMVMYDGNGSLFTNKYTVSVPTADMRLYTDEEYFYTDITVEGDNSFAATSTLEWETPVSAYSYLAVTSITTGGHLSESDEALETRIVNETSARNMVTGPGILSFYNDKHPGLIRDVLSVGMGEDEMLRDINTDLSFHTGNHIDIYMKEDLPVSTTLKHDILALDDWTFAESVSTIFQDTGETGSVYFKNLLPATEYTIVATSQARAVTFLEGTDYDIDRVNGIVTWDPGGDIIQDPTGVAWGSFSQKAGVGNERIMDGVVFGPTELYPGIFIKSIHQVTLIEEWFLVVAVDDSVNEFTVDRDLDSVVTYINYRYEPVQYDIKYHPMGIPLTEFTNPLMWIDTATVLDPLTDESYDLGVYIFPKGGYGIGSYGSGPYGLGSTEGWVLKPDDDNYRYSSLETGVLEFQGNYLGDRVEVAYRYAPNIEAFQTEADQYRCEGANVLIKAFTPTAANLTIDVTGDTGVTEITGIDEYIWTLSNRVELSDISDELYSLGATFVDLGDLINDSVFVKWKIDGTFETLTADSTGVLDINDRTSRLLPGDIEITVS